MKLRGSSDCWLNSRRPAFCSALHATAGFWGFERQRARAHCWLSACSLLSQNSCWRSPCTMPAGSRTRNAAGASALQHGQLPHVACNASRQLSICWAAHAHARLQPATLSPPGLLEGGGHLARLPRHERGRVHGVALKRPLAVLLNHLQARMSAVASLAHGPWCVGLCDDVSAMTGRTAPVHLAQHWCCGTIA